MVLLPFISYSRERWMRVCRGDYDRKSLLWQQQLETVGKLFRRSSGFSVKAKAIKLFLRCLALGIGVIRRVVVVVVTAIRVVNPEEEDSSNICIDLLYYNNCYMRQIRWPEERSMGSECRRRIGKVIKSDWYGEFQGILSWNRQQV